jgi:hypothetical protein
MFGSSQESLRLPTKVKWHSPNHRFVIALHSPDRLDETGPPQTPPEKKAGSLSIKYGGTISPVRFERGSCGIAAISADSRRTTAWFLCTQTEWRRERNSNSRYLFCRYPQSALCVRTYGDFGVGTGAQRNRLVRQQDQVVRFLWPTVRRRPGDHRPEGGYICRFYS